MSLGLTSALAGVVLTLVVQIITGAIQRRHDRILKTFDLRLDLYARTRQVLDSWAKEYKEYKRTRKDLDSAKQEYERSSDERTAMLKRTNELVTSMTVEGASPDQMKQARELLAEVKAAIEQQSADSVKASVRAHRIKALVSELEELEHRVGLIAGRQVHKALVSRVEKILSDIEPEHADFEKFDRAARKERGGS